MEYLKGKLIQELVRHFGDDTPRIDHALDVLAHAEALLSETPDADPEVVMAVAVTHDFGITEAERLHGRCTGTLQEQLGPGLVRPVLKRVGLAPEKAREVLRIIARHHSPPRRPSVNYCLMYECDWLVNVHASPKILATPQRIESFIARNFQTPAGIRRARRLLLGEEPMFARMGKVYKLLVDESARRRREKSFLLDTAESARRGVTGRKRPHGATPVLDLGCGTGFHARLFAREGYPVTAIDYSRPMLAEAKSRRSPGKIVYRYGDLLTPLDIAHPAALALILGNTLSVFESPAQLRSVMRHTADAMRPGGLLLCQILNYERLRRLGSSAVTRHGSVEGRETIVTKSLQVVEDGSVVITLAASQRGETGEWDSFSRATPLTPLEPKQLRAAAKRAGLQLEGDWGDLNRAAFDRENSTDYVAMFRK